MHERSFGLLHVSNKIVKNWSLRNIRPTYIVRTSIPSRREGEWLSESQFIFYDIFNNLDRKLSLSISISITVTS